jgi:hypothetical protein
MKIVVTKCKDNTFVVSNGRIFKNVSNEPELVATLYWFYSIKKNDTNYALYMMSKREHDMMELSLGGTLLNTLKLNYDEMWDDYDDY